MQAAARGMLARKEARAARRLAAAVTIQKWWRRHVAVAKYQREYSAIVFIQAAWRGHAGRVLASGLRENAAALRIQKWYPPPPPSPCPRLRAYTSHFFYMLNMPILSLNQPMHVPLLASQSDLFIF